MRLRLVALVLFALILLRSRPRPDPVVVCDCGCGKALPLHMMQVIPGVVPEYITPQCKNELYGEKRWN